MIRATEIDQVSIGLGEDDELDDEDGAPADMWEYVYCILDLCQHSSQHQIPLI